MSKRFYIILSAVIGCLFISACKNSGGLTLPSATGSIYECVIVADKTVSDIVEQTLAADMPCLPQMEPYFKTMNVPPKQFDDFLRSARNILYVDIQPARYTAAKAVYTRNRWSKPQAVCSIQAPDTAAFIAYWNEYGEQIREWLVREELARQVHFLRASTNKQARAAMQKRFGCDMLIPEDYMLIKDTVLQTTTTAVSVLWCCNNKGPVRRDIVVYSYPYTDSLTFTTDYLCHKRDEVVGQLVSGAVEGSYMGTEYKHFPPQMRFIRQLEGIRGTNNPMNSMETINPNNPTPSFYAAELRGLWRLYGGEAMGGPFVSHSLIVGAENTFAEKGTWVVTAEVFIYAAGQKKRNPLRQAEAILYSIEEN